MEETSSNTDNGILQGSNSTFETKNHRFFLIAGEASGDLHASNLMREISRLEPQVEFCFLGGDLMAEQGGRMVKHYREMAFMGFINVLLNARKILNNFAECKKAIQDFQPDALILIDYPSFNLRIAKYAKEKLHIPVYYYIAPKIWAWKEFRIKQIKQYVDSVFTILPFETDFYKKHNYHVNYVGNPSVDSVAARLTNLQDPDVFFFKNELQHKPIIAVLPGSRKQEIRNCLPTILNALTDFPDHQIVVSGAPGVETDFYKPFITGKNIRIVFDQTYELLVYADAAVVNSGTATLETALIGTPQVVVYQVPFGRLALKLKDIFIKVKYVSLVNLIAGKEVVKELLGHFFTAENVRKEVGRLLLDPEYHDKMLDDYREVKKTLGEPGAAKNAAAGIVDLVSRN